MLTVLPAPIAASGADGQSMPGMPPAEPGCYHGDGVYATETEPKRSWFVAAAKRIPYAEQAPEVPPVRFLRVGDLPDGWE